MNVRILTRSEYCVLVSNTNMLFNECTTYLLDLNIVFQRITFSAVIPWKLVV